MVPKSLIVSIHDVRPGLMDKVHTMLAQLEREGVTRTSLLVVPNFHREEPIENHPEFVAELNQLKKAGHEIVLHGFYHREEAPAKESPWEYLVSKIYTSSEGEFYRLPQEEVQERIRQGKALFANLGWKPTGFVAPAWLYSPPSSKVIQEEGFRYFTTLWELQSFEPPLWVRSRAIVWSHRALWRRVVSNLFLPYIANRIMRYAAPLRIAFHPPDFTFDSIQKCGLRILKKALKRGYEPITYQQFLEEVVRRQSAA